MNDRFKFRCWDKENKKFLHHLSFDLSSNGILILNGGIEMKKYLDVNDTDRYVLMQCTGLKDKNGKLIYEGDIVKDRIEHILIVSYENSKACFVLENAEYIGYISELRFTMQTVEVLGNIYENKELLKECE